MHKVRAKRKHTKGRNTNFMKREYKLFIKDIIESINKIQEYLKGITEEQFKKDIKLQDAVIRRIEIIGEATKNIPTSVKQANKDIPWIQMSNYRNFIIHSYFETSLQRIWGVAKDDIAKIKEALQKVSL